MRDYYYIRITVFGSDTLYLNKQNELVDSPEDLAIFHNVEDAVEAKRSTCFEWAYDRDQVEIKRF